MSSNKGIYKITNRKTGVYYVGSSNNIDQRWNNHCRLLNLNKHHNDYLQKAWNKYGEENFIFEVIEFLPQDIDEKFILLTEQKWLDKAKHEKSYNLTFDAFRPNAHLSEYSKQKRSISLKKVVKTEEWKKKISKSHIGLKHSVESLLKMNLAKKGTKQTNEQKEKATESRKKDWVFTSPIGEKIQIHDLKRFCKENGLHSGGMYWVASGKKYQYKGWRSYPPKEKVKYIANEEHRKNLSNGCAKNYTFISPKNEIVYIHNLAKFCKENKLDAGSMCKIAKGKIKSYKGWRK